MVKTSVCLVNACCVHGTIMLMLYYKITYRTVYRLSGILYMDTISLNYMDTTKYDSFFFIITIGHIIITIICSALAKQGSNT